MRYKLLTMALMMAALCWFLSGKEKLPTTQAQAPSGEPLVSPVVLAFLKPVEILPGDNELQKKLKERHNVAVKLLEELVKEYKKGIRDLNEVFVAARLTAEAKLDLAGKDPNARITTLEQILDVTKLVENHLQQLFDKGVGSQADVERAPYARLSVEIELLKAKNPGANSE